jgi:hypothetical protein
MTTEQTPEGELIAKGQRLTNISTREAARQAGISEGRWRQIVKGYQAVSAGTKVPVTAPPDTLARMANVVGVTPEQLEDAGRLDAAESHRFLFKAEPVPSSRFPEGSLQYLIQDHRGDMSYARLAARSGLTGATSDRAIQTREPADHRVPEAGHHQRTREGSTGAGVGCDPGGRGVPRH